MFNTEQQKAIAHKDGPLIVVAGPGSGKTTVVVNRTKALIEKGVLPENILVITFTKAAAKEMKLRFNTLTENIYPDVTFGTIHSISLKILVNSFGYSYDNVLNEQEKFSALRKIVKEQRIPTEDVNHLIKNLSNAIGLIKSGKLKPPYQIDCGCRPNQLEKAFQAYTEFCRKAHKIDYDDMQIVALQKLKKNKRELAYWQDVFQYIMVDEFQDTCDTQAELIYLLTGSNHNICVVGDDDQSLYRFRGAKPEVMLNFEKKFHAEKITLDTNYRSGAKIVKTTSSFIKTNEERFDKDFKSVRNGGKIEIKNHDTQETQAKKITSQIRSLLKKNVPYEEIAVIYRTNTESGKIIEQLMKKDIPFVASRESTVNMFEHWIFRDIINFHNICKDVSKADYNDLTRALKRPSQYIPNKAFQSCSSLFELSEWGYENKKPYISRNIKKFKDDMARLKKKKLADFLVYLAEDMGYRDALFDYADYTKQNPKELLDILDEIIDSAEPFETMEEWYEYAKDYTFTLKKSFEDNLEGVRLMTMHGSKGLEFQHVFIINANEEFTPFCYKGVIEDMEEERRMFYVAMTRAKDHLHINYIRANKGKEVKPSRFVNELNGILESSQKKKGVA